MRLSTLLVPAVLALFSVGVGESARILVLFPFPGKSHFNVYSRLLEELANRGHEVTVVSAYPRTTPLKNYKDVAIDDHLRQSGHLNFFESPISPAVFMLFFSKVFLSNCERFLNYPQIQNLIHSDEKYDLILFEVFFTECAYGFVHKFKAPFIQISSNGLCNWMGDGVGNPNFYSYVPDLILPYPHHMTFSERLHNSLFQTYNAVLRDWYIIPTMERIMRKHFTDPNLPTISEIERNASFLLLNSHVALNYPRPLTPNTAEVGGMHVEEPKKLPQNLQKYLDDSPEGVIFFSLGSHIRSTQMPLKLRNEFIKAFFQVKQKVLWKWEDDVLPGQPKNVRIEKWLPQNDILAHPNVKVFVSHGGLLSTQEATYHGMPVVAVPVMADQKVNALHAQVDGCAIALDIREITADKLLWALNEVINNPSYTENAKRRSRILRDQPMKPLETAAFWIEYVIRHNGAPHMRSAALKLNFFQYYCLDVIAVVLLCSLSALAVFVLTCRALCRRICSRKPQSVSKSKKSQ